MAWDAAAKNMAVNTIAKVEGGGAWDAINYNDPITLGLMQWFGTRAANLLVQIKADHPTEYGTIAASVRNDVANHPANSSWWTSRYLDRSEGNTIKPVLRASHDTQGNLVASDVDDYKKVCDNIGLSAANNTNTAIFFMCMYHQSPARAINIMKRIGMGSSLDRVYAACINEARLGDFKTRYTTAYNIIKSGTPPTIIDLNDDNDEGGDTGTGGSIGTDNSGSTGKTQVGISRISISGDQLVLHGTDGKSAFAVPTGHDSFIVPAQFKGVDVPPATPAPDEESPDVPPVEPGDDVGGRIVKFMQARIGKYAYSQGPSRLTPDSRNATDCSGLTRFAYLSVAKVDIGTYTDAQVMSNKTRTIQKGGGGNTPNESLMKPGDLVLSARYSTPSNRLASHVEIYMGGGKIIGHGGPMNGPIIKDLAPRTADKKTWWIKRLNGL